MLNDFRKTAVSYWEKRRLIFNLLLLPPAWFGWDISADFTYSIDDHIPAHANDPFVVRSAVYALLTANIYYSMVYVLEVYMMSEKKRSFWPKSGRLLVFCTGCALGMLLATSYAARIQTTARGPWREHNYEEEEANPESCDHAKP